ncbi:hypothetical protein MAH1_27030 [Sessilibacter sp. MAH1]
MFSFWKKKNAVLESQYRVTQDLIQVIDVAKKSKNMARHYATDPKGLGAFFAGGVAAKLLDRLYTKASFSDRKSRVRIIRTAQMVNQFFS